ncbi:MAG TPA: DUF885 family protein [Vicinamibacterales bacterium]|nr:DUF885 family protein [Vicinamibacterales bacterium]
MMRWKIALAAAVCAAAVFPAAAEQTAAQQLQRPPGVERTFADPAAYVPEVPLVAAASELRDLVERYGQDRQALARFHTVPGSDVRRERFRAFNRAWLAALPTVDFTKLSQQGRVDYVALRNEIEYELALLDREERAAADTRPLLPFAGTIAKLQEDRQALRFIGPDEALEAVKAVDTAAKQARAAVESGALKATPTAAFRAAQQAEALRGALQQWFAFYNGYDPAFSSRVPMPFQAATSALTAYIGALRERLVDWPSGADEPIVGNPIGREGLMEDLRAEMIPYTPEQLIEIGNREYAWIENEMKKASREMGMGDDWHAALDKVKDMYVPKGEQPELIRNLALEAEAYLRKHDLVTIPPLASDIWKMNMMSPQRQRVNPFFTGGETISVSYPHVSMAAADQSMSLRGNGIHVSRATVHHELIPGHHLQGFMSTRYNGHRTIFDTPFMTEGWALYWEMLLWDHGFPRSPEDKLGMLWWRMHRATRIIFSLNFHMGNWTPEQAITFLVEKGRHDRFTATGEVRRSFNSTYSPLYQAAYMLGGLQIRSMYKDLVETKTMTAKAFHDAILRQGEMPIELLRAALTDAPLTPAYQTTWKFYGEIQ